ncbi:MAG: MFS transporter [Clostridia bacterium]
MLWKNRPFVKMFLAYGLSAFGDWFDFMAVSILMGYIWQEGPLMIALLPLSFAVPGILFSQFAGILADRWNKRNVMIATDVIRGAITVLMIFSPNAWVMLGLIALRSTARVFHYPAQQAMTRQVVAEDQLLQATSLNGTVFQLSKVLGPLLGATLASSFSPALCMGVNATSFFISAMLLLMIQAMHGESTSAVAQTAGRIRLHQAWREGWGLLLSRRILFVTVFFALVAMFAIQLIDAQFTVLMRDIAPDRPELVGWVVTAVGLGGLVTVTWLQRLKQLTAYGWIFGGGITLIGVMFAFSGLYQPHMHPIWMLLAAFIGGIGTGFTFVGTTYVLQKETPESAVGRVSGIYDSLTSTILILAPLSGGLIIEQWGAAFSFSFVGVLICVIGLIGLIFQRFLWGKRQEKLLHFGQNPLV